MNRRLDVAMLLARVQLIAPDARSILIASIGDAQTSRISRELAATIHVNGNPVRWLRLAESAMEESDADGVSRLDLLEADFRDLSRLRRALSPAEGYLVVAGESPLRHPRTLLTSAAVDAVVVACRRQTTSRAELRETRDEIERAGGHLLGSILLG
jgi:hypothetical protein